MERQQYTLEVYNQSHLLVVEIQHIDKQKAIEIGEKMKRNGFLVSIVKSQ